jgi:hypothetical protein
MEAGDMRIKPFAEQLGARRSLPFRTLARRANGTIIAHSTNLISNEKTPGLIRNSDASRAHLKYSRRIWLKEKSP